MVTSANCIDVDKSNSLLYVGYENGRLGMINLNNPQIKEPIKAHDGSINAMGINLTNTNLYTVGSDGILNIWQ
jgi:WD40 repeat protein